MVRVLAFKLDYYAPIADRILQARSSFLAWTDSLPAPIAKTIEEMSRGNRKPGSLLGERDAFWLGELFRASEELQQIAALGCMAGYAYVLDQDHSVESGEPATLNRMLARNYLYAKMLESFQIVAGNQDNFWRGWNHYLKEYTEACLFEVRKEAERYAYNTRDLKMVARRSGLVKICMAAFALATSQEQKIARYEEGIDQLTIGLQIRDDLADVFEDVEAGQYSFVISYVISRLARAARPTVTEIQRTVVESQVIEELLDESTAWLKAAGANFELPRESALDLYIQHLIAENAEFARAITQTKHTDDPWAGISKILPRLEPGY